MKTKSIFIIFSLLLIVVLSGCSDKSPKPVNTPPEIVNDIQIDKGIESGEKEQKDIEANAVEGNTTLKISKYLAVVNPDTFNEAAYIREHDGVVAAQISEDGSVTVRITETKQKEISNSLKGGLESVLAGLVVNPETSYIQNVEITEGYKEIILTVDKEGYEKSDKSIISFLSTTVGAYQTYAGLGYNVTISLKDLETGSVLVSEKYPDKIEADMKAAEEEAKLAETHTDEKDKKEKDNIDKVTETEKKQTN